MSHSFRFAGQVAALALAALGPACSSAPPAAEPELIVGSIGVQQARVGEAFSFQLVATVTPASALTYALAHAPEGMTVSESGLVTWTPAANQAGTHLVDITITGATTPAVISHARLDIVVTQGNRAPMIDALTAGQLQLAPGGSTTLTALAHDADGDALTFKWTVAQEGWNVTGSGASVVVTAPSMYDALAELTLEVSDGTEKVTRTIGLTTAKNTAPQLAPVVATPNPVKRGGTVLLEAFAVDADGDALSYAWSATGGFTLEGQGARVTAIAPNEAGVEGKITVEVTDAAGAKTSAQTTLRTLPNARPLVSSVVAQPAVVARGGTVALHARAVDPDGDALTYAWTVPAGWTGTSTTDALTLTAPALPGRSDVVSVTVSDGEESTTADVVIGTLQNRAPQIDSLVLGQNPVTGTTTTAVVASAQDADGDALTYAWKLSNAEWTLAGSGDTVQLTAPAIEDGASSETKVTLTVTDSAGAVAERSVWATAGLAPKIEGTVEWLGTSGLVLDVNGTAFAVSQAGPFTAPVRVLAGMPYSVTIRTQPAGQSCSVLNGAGLALDGAAQSVKVSCVLSLKSTRTATEAFDTGSTSYVDVPGLAPISFRTSKQASALLTFAVPHVRSTTPGDFSDAWFVIEVDGTVAGETSLQSAVWAQGGPVSIVTVAPLAAGSHTVKALLKMGSLANPDHADAKVTLEPTGQVQLTATVLDSLSMYDGAVQTAVSGAQQTSASTWSPLANLGASVPVTQDQPLLLALQVPSALAPGGQTTMFRLRSGSDVLGETHFRHEGSRKGATILSFDTAPASGTRSYAAEWFVSSADEGAAETAGALQLTAVAFKQALLSGTSVKRDAASTWDGSEAPIDGLAPVTLTLAKPAKVLLTFQASSMHVDGNGPSGLVTVKAGTSDVAWAHVQSQNSNWSSPVSAATVVELPAGSHTFTAAWRANHPGNSVHLDQGVTRLTALVLE